MRRASRCSCGAPTTRLWYGRIDAGGWRGWRSAGGSILSGPAVSGNGTGMYVFVTGGDGGVWVNRFSSGTPTSWISLGGAPSLDLAAAADDSGVAVYARGSVNALYRRRLSGSVFLPWESLGGHITSSPAVVGGGAASSLFARGLDGALYVQKITGGVPNGWQSLGGAVTADPTATVDATGTTVLVRGNDFQLWGERNEGSWPGWSGLGGVPMSTEPFAVSTPVVTAAPPPPPTGRGFDACEAPSIAQMGVWRLASPYTSAGIYIGGENRACANNAFNSSTWVNSVVAQGWRLIPIYVGLQAPCISFSSNQISRDLPTAGLQGLVNAENAADRASAAGIPPGPPIYFDMEGYNNADAGCVAAVRAFVNGWVSQLHARVQGGDVQQPVLRDRRSGRRLQQSVVQPARRDLVRGLALRRRERSAVRELLAESVRHVGMRRRAHGFHVALPPAHPPVPAGPQRDLRRV